MAVGTPTEPGLEHVRFLRSPRAGRDVCVDCFDLTHGFSRCFNCSRATGYLAAMVPISYSVGGEYLHHLLADYKRLQGPRGEAAKRQIAQILNRFLARHEACLAAAARIQEFDVVTAVPSSHPRPSGRHALQCVIEQVQPAKGRYQDLLDRTAHPVQPHRFDPRRFAAAYQLDGVNVLLIDDMWTTGASAQAAAGALLHAGANSVAALVVGRHLNREWDQNDLRVQRLHFDWDTCALCATETRGSKAA